MRGEVYETGRIDLETARGAQINDVDGRDARLERWLSEMRGPKTPANAASEEPENRGSAKPR